MTISVLLVKGLPSALIHSTVGVGIPAVTRHWNKALPPRIIVWVASGYSSIAGTSLPNSEIQEYP